MGEEFRFPSLSGARLYPDICSRPVTLRGTVTIQKSGSVSLALQEREAGKVNSHMMKIVLWASLLCPTMQ
jgi:hypothetical protein